MVTDRSFRREAARSERDHSRPSPRVSSSG